MSLSPSWQLNNFNSTVGVLKVLNNQFPEISIKSWLHSKNCLGQQKEKSFRSVVCKRIYCIRKIPKYNEKVDCQLIKGAFVFPSLLQYLLQLHKSQMESKLSSKRNEFSKQIRRHQINTIIAEYRSKLVNSLQQQEEQLEFLDKVLQQELNRFSKIKIILQTMSNMQNALDTQMGLINDNKGFVSLFCDNKVVKVQVKLNALQSIQIDNLALITILRILAKDICTKIQITNINFQQSLKINVLQTLIAKITIIKRQISQLVQIAEICNFLLSILANLLLQNTEINVCLLRELTSCLIELSCFKPRQYSSNQQLEIAKQVNNKMGELRELLNTSITSNLYKLVKHSAGKELSINIIINILYIFGNIFVSLSFNCAAHTQQYKELHDLCFDLIRKSVLQINPSMQSEQAIHSQSKHKQFSQFSSVIIWFIRNEVLIIEGLYRASKDLNKNSTDEPANEQWIILIVNILEYFANHFKRYKQTSPLDATTLCDIASLLKLLKYDFQLQLSSLCECLKFLQTFLRTCKEDAGMNKLKTHIYELAEQLLAYQAEEITQITQANPSYMELYSFVYEQALAFVKGQNQNAESIELCSAILSNFCNYKPIKQSFYQEVCSRFEAVVGYMSRAVSCLSYEQIKQRIIFMYELVKQIENHQGGSMQNELLSYKSISAILQLCSGIWENSKNSDCDIICTLSLLKVIAENEEWTNLLKEVMTGQGYFQQLQNLQALVSAQINLLAYEICELLEIQ